MSVLAMPSLVLNRAWVPIRVTNVEDAITKLLTGAAKAVTEDYTTYNFEDWSQLRVAEGEPCIRTYTLSIRIPEVIILARYGEVPERKLVFSRANIYKRDRYTCQYCSRRLDMKELTIDHVFPRSKGGVSSWTNCVLSCWDCNSKKADKTLAESGLKLLKHPIKPNWSPRHVIARFTRNAPKVWEKFVSEAYWNVALDET
jgi:5-methylcytosine-specific restriction endonuclease McrA